MHLRCINFPTHKSFQLSIVFGVKKFQFSEVLMRVIQLD